MYDPDIFLIEEEGYKYYNSTKLAVSEEMTRRLREKYKNYKNKGMNEYARFLKEKPLIFAEFLDIYDGVREIQKNNSKGYCRYLNISSPKKLAARCLNHWYNLVLHEEEEIKFTTKIRQFMSDEQILILPLVNLVTSYFSLDYFERLY